VSLPADDEAFMPAEGKTPLTANQITILSWWVTAGAPRDTTVGTVGAPDDVEPLLAAQLGLGGATAAAPAPATATATADASLVAQLAAAGLLARQVSQTDARLVVSPSAPGTALGAAGLEALAAAAAEIVDLNLAGAALDDAGVAAIGTLPAVTHLRLARNRLTDRAIAALAASPQLVHLNVYDNAGITDIGLAQLADSTALRELYVWRTGATAEGVAQLRARRPDLVVSFGAEPAATVR